MALGDSQAGGGTGTGDWAAGAGGNWSGNGSFGAVTNPGGTPGQWGGNIGNANGYSYNGWNDGAGPSVPWQSIMFGPTWGIGQVDFSQYADPNYYSAANGFTGVSGGGGNQADIPSANASPMMGVYAPTEPIAPAISSIDPYGTFSAAMDPRFTEQGLLTDQTSLATSMGPTFVGVGLSPAWSDIQDIVSDPPETYDATGARTLAGVAAAEARGQGLLGQQAVLGTIGNRADYNWGGFGTSPVSQATAPGQYAAPYNGPLDAMQLDMAGLAMQGMLPDLTDGAMSFRADRPSALDDAHRSLEARGSQSMYGHVFSDYSPFAAGMPPERPQEFGPSAPVYADVPTPPDRPAELGGSYGLAAIDPYGFSNIAPGFLAEAQPFTEALQQAQAPSMLGSLATAGAGAARSIADAAGSLFDRGLEPGGRVSDLPEYTEPEGIRGPKDFTDRLPGERPPSLEQQYQAAYQAIAQRAALNARDQAASGYTMPTATSAMTGPMYANPAFASTFGLTPEDVAAQQSLPALPSMPDRTWTDTMRDFVGIGGAQAATPAAPQAYVDPSVFSPEVTPGANAGFGYSSSFGPPTSGFVGASRAASPAPAGISAPAVARGAPAASPVAPAAPAAPTETAPASDYMSGYYVDPLTRQAYGTPPGEPTTMGKVAQYGLPVVGGLIGGPIGGAVGWLAGKGIAAATAADWKGQDWTGGSYAPAPPANGNSDEAMMAAVQAQQQEAARRAAAAAAVNPAPPPASTGTRNVIHMPSRNAWLTLPA